MNVLPTGATPGGGGGVQWSGDSHPPVLPYAHAGEYVAMGTYPHLGWGFRDFVIYNTIYTLVRCAKNFTVITGGIQDFCRGGKQDFPYATESQERKIGPPNLALGGPATPWTAGQTHKSVWTNTQF